MANRTISLSPMCDLIRKQLVETKGIPFSMWVSNQLVEWNRTTRKEEQEAKAVKPPVPFNYTCQKCMRVGLHWTMDCDWYGEEE